MPRVSRTVLIAAVLGGVIGVGTSSALVSDRSTILSVPLAPVTEAVLVQHLRYEIFLSNSGQAQNEQKVVASLVDRAGVTVLQLRATGGSEADLTAVGERIWEEARKAALSGAIALDSAPVCRDSNCSLWITPETLVEFSALADIEEFVPQEFPDNYEVSTTRNGPSNTVVLAGGAAIGAILGGVTVWGASRFPRNSSE